MLNRMVNEFDLVVLDSPPLMPVTDAMLLSTMVDGVVLVVNSSKTAKQHVRAAYSRLEFARAKVFGVLLNEVDVNSPHYKHYRQYYGGYGYAHPYKSDETSDGPDFGDSVSRQPRRKLNRVAERPASRPHVDLCDYLLRAEDSDSTSTVPCAKQFQLCRNSIGLPPAF